MENTGSIEDSRDPAASKKLGTDPFDNNESDPAKSNAMSKFYPESYLIQDY